jgi:endo-1,4-beta-xylanase
MKPLFYIHRKQLNLTSLVFTLLVITSFAVQAQSQETKISIEKFRKGEITVLAKPGVDIKIEQLSHEFWFGSAISNGIFSGSASEKNKAIYKEKFLENFNSAVTENAVKWGNMERKKGEVNYSVVDAMLNWTEDNNIPLRGHNIFWGVPKFVQAWLKEMDDAELQQALQNRAESVATRYKGRFAE